jgi:hypothetical protein
LVLALSLLANVADFFGTFGFMWIILRSNLSVDQYFGDPSALLKWSTWVSFLSEQGILALVAASIFVSFSLGKREGKTLFAIAQTLFPRSKTPRALSGIRAAVAVPFVVLAYLVNLFLMAYFIDNPIILAFWWQPSTSLAFQTTKFNEKTLLGILMITDIHHQYNRRIMIT